MPDGDDLPPVGPAHGPVGVGRDLDPRLAVLGAALAVDDGSRLARLRELGFVLVAGHLLVGEYPQDALEPGPREDRDRLGCELPAHI